MEQPAYDRVCIYSNGMGDFTRRYPVTQEATQLAIPVKTRDIGDFLLSFSLLTPGVTLLKPPSFEPQNRNEGTITIDPTDVYGSLFKSLRGAKVKIETPAQPPLEGSVVGLDQAERNSDGHTFFARSVVLMTPAGVRAVSLDDIINGGSVVFTDAAVQSEVEKALKRAFQTIKQDSSYVNFSLQGEAGVQQAEIQYTVPLTAWKMSYRYRGSKEGRPQFMAFAHIDNPTDEDWVNYLVSVVTGEPITFSTDIAEAKTVGRSHRNLVREHAQGHVLPSEVMEDDSFADMPLPMAAEPDTMTDTMFPEIQAPLAAPPVEHQQLRGGIAMGASAISARDERLQVSAEAGSTFAEASASQVGDLAIWETDTPVTIPAKTSAVIPVFVKYLDDCRSIIFFDATKNSERGFSTIVFKNTTGNNLEEGPLTVFEEGCWEGQTILPHAQKGSDALLMHAINNSVRFQPRVDAPANEWNSLRIEKGILYTCWTERRTITYHFKNLSPETHQAMLDHQPLLTHDSRLHIQFKLGNEELQPKEKTRSGWRLAFEIAAGSEAQPPGAQITVEEKRIAYSSVHFDRHSVHVITQAGNNFQTLLEHPRVQAVSAAGKTLQDAQHVLHDLNHKSQALGTEQKRLLSILGGVGWMARWKHRSRLDQAEEELRSLLHQTIPQQEKIVREAEEAYEKALTELEVALGDQSLLTGLLREGNEQA